MSAKILIFDSGLGGLSVARAVRAASPDAVLVYAADNAKFPYGALTETELINRVLRVMTRLIEETAPDIVAIACNTASTLVLEPLREKFDIPFVGTVPAIKVAASKTKTGLISVLGTPGTVRRDYTLDLIEQYADSHNVVLVGAVQLARIAEEKQAGQAVDIDQIKAEIADCFVIHGAQRTDCVVLACTHYPLLLEELQTAAPWPVIWIDPSEAIARQTLSLIGDKAGKGGGPSIALFTGAFDPASPAAKPFIELGMSQFKAGFSV